MTAYTLINELMELCEKNKKFLNLETTSVLIQTIDHELPKEIDISFKGYVDDNKNNKFQIIIKPKK